MATLTIQDLITLYNNTESRIERANLWSHIEEKIEEISFEHNSDNDYSGSLYFTDEDALSLSNERVAYQRGYIQALNDLILR